jgi:Na+-translocating ferredoxin:NAD+ oxidoreductase subunit A
MSFIGIVLTACILVVIVCTYMAGLCPVFYTTGPRAVTTGLTGAVIVTMVCTGLTTWIVRTITVDLAGIPFLEIIMMPVAVYGAVFAIEKGYAAVAPAAWERIRKFSPIIRANNLVLGASFLLSGTRYGLGGSLGAGVMGGVGCVAATFVFFSIREQLEFDPVPEGLQGTPVAMITAGLLMMVFFSLDQMLLTQVIR